MKHHVEAQFRGTLATLLPQYVPDILTSSVDMYDYIAIAFWQAWAVNPLKGNIELIILHLSVKNI